MGIADDKSDHIHTGIHLRTCFVGIMLGNHDDYGNDDIGDENYGNVEILQNFEDTLTFARFGIILW